MKRIVFLLILVALCVAPFWKSEYRRRWEARQEEKREEKAEQPGCGTVMPTCGTAIPENRISPEGKALFKTNCAACHSLTQKEMTGPGLFGVLERIPGGNWKYDFIRDSQKMIKSGDAYAVYRDKEYKNSVMPSFPNLTNEQIDAILGY